MAAELIGTVYVRVRALTADLQKDMQRGIERGAKSVDTDKAGKQLGADLGDSISTETETELNKKLPDAIADAFNDAGDPKKNSSLKRSLRNASSKISQNFTDRFRYDLNKNTRGRKNPFEAIGDAFQRGVKNIRMPGGFIGWLAILGVPALGGAVKIIGGYLVGLTAQLGLVATAAAGAGIVLGGLFAAVGPAGFVLFKGLTSETEALEAFSENVKELLDPWGEITDVVQGAVFPALEEFLFVITEGLQPAFLDFSGEIASAFSDFVRFAGMIMTNEQQMGIFSRILDEGAVIFRELLEIVLVLIRPLSQIFAAALGPAASFTDALRETVDKFSEFIDLAYNSGELDAQFADWYDSLVIVWAIIRDLSIALWNVFQVGSDVVKEFYGLSGAVDRVGKQPFWERWREFTSSEAGQDRITEIFNNALPVLQETNRLIVDIWNAIMDPVFDGDNEGIIGFLTTMREDFLPLLQELAGSIAENAGDALNDFFLSLIEFVTQLSESGSLATFLSVLAASLDALAAVLTAPGVAQAAGILLPLAAGLKAVHIATFGMSTKVITGLASAFGTFFTVFVNGGTAAQAMASVGRAGGILAKGFALLTTTAAGPIVLAIAAGIGIFIAAFKNWDKIKDFFNSLPVWGKLLAAFFVLFTPVGWIIGLVGLIKAEDAVPAAARARAAPEVPIAAFTWSAGR